MFPRVLTSLVALGVLHLAAAAGLAQHVAGEFNLQDPANAKEAKVTLKSSIKSDCSLKYWSLGHTGIHATFKFENTTQEAVYYAGFVALYDADKSLVGCLHCGSSRFSKLDPGKVIEEQINLALPLAELKRIRSFQARVLIDTKEPGK